MPGPADAMKLVLADGTQIPLGNGWHYTVVQQDFGTTPRVPGTTSPAQARCTMP